MVMGTVGYMSPEQVRGLPADTRSDVFSFGLVLYEMLSGRRAFRGETPAETLAAIINNDPPELGRLRPEVFPALERIVARCLEKRPEERFQSARDIAFAIEALSGAPPAGRARRPAFPRRLGPPAGGLRRPPDDTRGRLPRGPLHGAQPGAGDETAHPGPGLIHSARFAPDGRTILYSAAGEAGPPVIYSTTSEAPEPTPLGLPPAVVLGASSTGEMAVLLNRDANTSAGHPCSRRPRRRRTPGAGRPSPGRKLGPGRAHALRPAGRQGRPPAARVPHGGGALPPGLADRVPSCLAKRGPDRVFRWRRRSGHRHGRKEPDDPHGPDVPRARARLVATGRRGVVHRRRCLGRTLYAVTLSGKQRVVYRVPGAATLEDISTRGQVLLTHGFGQAGIVVLAPGETRERELSGFARGRVADLSPDGKTLLVEEGDDRGPGRSDLPRPDRWFLARAAGGGTPLRSLAGREMGSRPLFPASPSRLILLPTVPGEPKPVPLGHIDPLGGGGSPTAGGCWSRGGSRKRPSTVREGPRRRRRARPDPGRLPPARPHARLRFPRRGVSRRKVIAALGSDFRISLVPVEGGEPRESPGLGRAAPIRWSADGRSLFVRGREGVPARVYRVDPSTGQRELLKELLPSDPTGIAIVDSVQMTPDGSPTPIRIPAASSTCTWSRGSK